MSKLINYNGTEAANLALGQGGVDFLTGSVAVTPDIAVHKRWINILILVAGGSGTLTIIPETGDTITISSTEQADLLGVSLTGAFKSIDPDGAKLIAYRG
jgi:hypothetical protein|tara:strand:- start:83 stop:382 length:300 start_codon:yes stop_codon:yes gene_type:complete